MLPTGRAPGSPIPMNNGAAHARPAPRPQKRSNSGSTSPTKLHNRAADIRIMAILESASSPMVAKSDSSPITQIRDDSPPRKRAVGRPPSSESVAFKKPTHMLQKLAKKTGRRTRTIQNGMPPPALPNKVNFRARALDPLRQMPIHIVGSDDNDVMPSNMEVICNNKVAKKPLFSVPSGMEKEEEKELHLRIAIEAQKAASTGGNLAGHHIPIRPVEVLSPSEYDKATQWEKDVHRGSDYIEQQRGDFDFCDDDTSYDADEQDVDWLEEHDNFISLEEFENLMEKIEVLAKERVPDLDDVVQKHPELDLTVVEQVYDYWTAKKCALVKRLRMNACLVPLVPSKPKPGEKDNPYIAFRHRGPRVTTRRKQKLESEHYGTILRLAAMMRRTHLLTKAMVQRDRTKIHMMDVEEKMFESELAWLDTRGSMPDTLDEGSCASANLHTSWLNPMWFDVANDVLEINKSFANRISVSADTASSYDGRFCFVRQPQCYYRAHGNSADDFVEEDGAVNRAVFTSPFVVTENTAKNDLSFVDESAWRQLTGSDSSAYVQARLGRSSRLNLVFVQR